MKANEIYDSAGCNAARYAVESGAYPSIQAWETAKTRRSAVPSDRLEVMIEEATKHRRELTAFIKQMRRSRG